MCINLETITFEDEWPSQTIAIDVFGCQISYSCLIWILCTAELHFFWNIKAHLGRENV